MSKKKWLLCGLLLLSGPTWFPMALEFIALTEILGVFGLFTLYSSYAKYMFLHPAFQRFLHFLMIFDPHRLMLPKRAIWLREPRKLLYALPLRSLLFWSVVPWCFW
ncbi:hypothetical protein [Shewanella sp. YIC-542]|uniref:hypothetical protein n=1 Tax=Shewanella mytili TaxID=3377111 RepID=UPI00398E8560